MRSLTADTSTGGGTSIGEGDCSTGADNPRVFYENKLARLKQQHHSQCLFCSQSPGIPDITVFFDDRGCLHGTFTTTARHQGYDGRVHGGLIAGIIDASMAQCLMGHGVAGYTADLKIQYRQPVVIGASASLCTRIIGVNVGILYTMSCEIVQNRKAAVEATARFYKFA